MKTEYIFFILFFVFGISSLKAQEQAVSDSLSFASFDCGIVQTKQKLSKKAFASTTPLYLRVNNSDYVYATLQLGKRKSKIFMYIQILDKNVCVKKDKILDVFF